MNITSFYQDIDYNENRVVTKVILESSFSKEIRILLKEGQTMKEHKTAYPIIVQILKGAIDFGVKGSIHSLVEGSIVTLEGNVPHDLTATKDSIVRLTLSNLDKAERVEQVAKNS